jgi:hypothetical protein
LWAKLEEVAARIALIMHLVRCAFDDRTLVTTDAVDSVSMQMGIILARWFGHEGRRIYAVLAETEEQRDLRQLIELIQRKGNRISARDLAKATRRFRNSDEAEGALIELVEGNAGRWQNVPTTSQGGRATRVFELCVGETPSQHGENQGFGYADGSREAGETTAGDGEENVFE